MAAKGARNRRNSEAGLTVDQLDPARIREQWVEVTRTPPPRYVSRTLLMRMLADRIQAARYGGISADLKRRLLKIAGAIKKGEEVIGSQTRVKVVKNKVAPPFRQTEFDIIYIEGISKEGELVDIGSESGIIDKSGAWYSYGGQRIGQGRENAKMFLKDNPAMMAEVEEKVKVVLGLKRDESPVDLEVTEE